MSIEDATDTLMTPVGGAAAELQDAPARGRCRAVCAVLRESTRTAHQATEAIVQARLDGGPEAIAALLCRFYAFHQVWEPAIGAHPFTRGVFVGRARLPALEADLDELGWPASRRAGLPVCQAALGLLATGASAAGSLYVIEGSTLGGAVLAKVLAGRPGLPPQLRYFGGRNGEAGRLWRVLQDWLETACATRLDETLRGARATFALLAEWLSDDGYS